MVGLLLVIPGAVLVIRENAIMQRAVNAELLDVRNLPG
jgi:hypothetical protein